jgi:hypothetical protein
MRYTLHRNILRAFAASLLLLVADCNSNPHPQMALDTIRTSSDSTETATDTIRTRDTAKIDTMHAGLPPMAKAIDPSRLAQFLPKMAGWTPSGELQKEIQIRDNFNKSRAAQTYTQDQKKVTIEINDFAYVPSFYEPWQKYQGTYLNDDNNARTETTTIAGYRAVQTMQKHIPQAEVTVFSGKRYVVTVLEDGAENINEAHKIAASIDFKGLELLQ